MGEDERGEENPDFCTAFEVRGATDGKNRALHVGSRGNGDELAGDDGKIHPGVERIAWFCGSGPDRGSRNKLDPSSGGQDYRIRC